MNNNSSAGNVTLDQALKIAQAIGANETQLNSIRSTYAGLPATPAAPAPAPAPKPVTATNGPVMNSGTVSSLSNVNSGPMTVQDFSRGSTLPDPSSYIASAKNTSNPSFSDVVSGVATSTLDSTQKAIDQLQAQRQSNLDAEKRAAQEKRDALAAGVKDFVGSTVSQDAQKKVFDQFQVDSNIALLGEIKQKIVNAQEALNLGMVYEGDRPARMTFITGAQSTLKQQGLATIGALQGTAAVIQGNLELAKAYADATVSAIQSDQEVSYKALTTLLDLADKDLVSVSEEERGVIDSRIKTLNERATQLQENKDQVVDLMTKYPDAFLKGGVTLLDTKEQALKKMLPFIAERDRIEFQAKINEMNAKGAGVDGLTPDQKKALSGYLAEVPTYADRETALAELNKYKASILLNVGQIGYDQLVAEIDRLFPAVDAAAEAARNAPATRPVRSSTGGQTTTAYFLPETPAQENETIESLAASLFSTPSFKI